MLDRLPPEVSLEILNFLPMKDLVTCAQIPQLRNLALDPYLWKKFKRKTEKKLSDACLKKMVNMQKWTELHLAVYQGNILKIKQLKHLADVTDRKGNKPIDIAIRKSHAEACLVLLN